MVKTKHVLRFLLWLLPLLAGTAQAAGEAVAEVDRDRIYFGESLTLTIALSGKARGHEPDLAPLRDDFAVLGTGTSTRMQIVNGNASMEVEWRIQLEPIRSGKLVIPPLRVGPYVTDAIPLEVLPASQMPRGQNDTVFIEVQAEPNDPYVQQQVLVTVRLFHAVSLLDGTLDEPEGDDWMVQRLDKQDTRYETRRNGRRYGVVERRYALFPQKSGTLTLPPLRFQGRIATQGSMNRFFDQGRAIRRQSQPLRFQVRPRPAGYPQGAAWLPARNLELWEDLPLAAGLKQGEPVTRTLMLKADGLLAAQLPDLPAPVVDGLSAYPDQPVTREEYSRQGVHSVRQQKMALVPNRAGELELPELVVPWWNTETDRLEYARLPARKLQVKPAAGGSTPAVQPTTAADGGEPADQAEATVAAGPQPVAGLPAWVWPWVALLLLLGWLANAVFCLRRRLPVVKETTKPALARVDDRAARKAWQQAQEAGDLAAMQAALLQWARLRGHAATSLGELARSLGEGELADEIRALEQARYKPGTGWNPQRLAALLKDGLPAPKPARSKVVSALPGLYD